MAGVNLLNGRVSAKVDLPGDFCKEKTLIYGLRRLFM